MDGYGGPIVLLAAGAGANLFGTVIGLHVATKTPPWPQTLRKCSMSCLVLGTVVVLDLTAFICRDLIGIVVALVPGAAWWLVGIKAQREQDPVARQTAMFFLKLSFWASLLLLGTVCAY